MKEELLLGKIPFKIKDKIIFITPVFNNYIETTDNTICTTYVKYKNKFVLCDYFFDKNNIKKYYKDYIEDINFINLFNCIFENSNLIDDGTTFEHLLNDKSILVLNKVYSKENVNDILKSILAISKEDFEKQEEYEDYDLSDYFKENCQKSIEKYNSNFKNNIAKIYLMHCLLYPGFIKYFIALFNLIEKDNYNI